MGERERTGALTGNLGVLFQLKGVGVVQTDLETGRLVRANREFCEMVGYTEAELQALTYHELTHPDDRARDAANFAAFQRGELRGSDAVTRVLRRDGATVWLELHVSILHEAGHTHNVAVAHDVTERKRAEKALMESEARYRIVAETASDVLVTIDQENTILYLNLAAEKIFGHRLEKMLGQNLNMLMPEYLRHVHKAGLKRYRETGRKHISWDAVEVPGLHRDGHEIDLEISFGEHKQEGHHLFTAIIRDITERKQAEEALAELNQELEEKVRARTRQVQDLAGQLTLAEAKERARLAQVLHDELQQQLYAVGFALRNLRLQLRDDAAALTKLGEIKGLVDEAVAISRTTTANLSPPVLHNEGLVEALSWLGSDMVERYGLSVKVDAHDAFPVPNEAVRVLLFNLVRELLFNVVKRAQVNKATVKLMEDPDQLILTVHDLGKGFDPAALNETTTGSGLAGVRKRLELFGGRLDLVSAPAKGTRVSIVVPTGLLTLG